MSDGYSKAVDYFVDCIRKGCLEAWFKWLEWIVLTSALLAAARLSDSLILSLVAHLCVVILAFSIIVLVDRFIRDFRSQHLFIRHDWFWRLFSWGISIFQLVVLYSIANVIQALVENA